MKCGAPRRTEPEEDAERRIAATGARATNARVGVLSTLLAAREALTHHDIGVRLQVTHDVDRVTLYRVLDWLVERGLAHKLATEDRVWRFSAGSSGGSPTDLSPGTAHAHFCCVRCGRIVCLDTARMAPLPLPAGFAARDVEVTVKGACADCASPL